MKRLAAVLALTLGLGLAPVASAQTFRVYTQNLLRFGHGDPAFRASQCVSLVGALAESDVAVVQEFMDRPPMGGVPFTVADFCPGLNPALMAEAHNWTVVLRTPAGQGSYVEHYAFLFRQTPRRLPNGAFAPLPSAVVAGGKRVVVKDQCPACARAPVFIQVELAPGRYFWLGNFHATWSGKAPWSGVTARRMEALEAGRQVKGLARGRIKLTGGGVAIYPPMPVVIAGDWNLRGTDAGFNWNATRAWIAPDPGGPPTSVKTSLNAQGRQSQPYDRVILTMPPAWGGLLPPPPPMTLVDAPCGGFPDRCQIWRQTTSDHLGVLVEVTL